MDHSTPLIVTLVGGLGLAFVFGAIASKLRISPIVGYLLAGIAAGPFTPGFVADQGIATSLAEIGIILLMFGVGLHFSIRDLLSVRAIAVPGAIVQIAVATALGMLLARFLGWNWGGGLIFGLALSVASTVVLLRALEERGLVTSERGRIAVGWLIVEDIAMVLALVLLPTLAGAFEGGDTSMRQISLAVALTLVKVSLFVAVMLLVGRRVIPLLLHLVAEQRELFRLAVLAVALGVAFGAAKLFGVSFALGAFFAGMMLSESKLSHRAAEESLPLRDAFAVLFFVSVGMLFNPAIIYEEPLAVVATLAIVLVGKSIAAFVIVLLFRYPVGLGMTIAASLSQIGEFSFILVGLGTAMGVLPPEGRDLVLAVAMISILVNPLAFGISHRLEPWIERLVSRGRPAAPVIDASTAAVAEATEAQGHTVLVGYGRVGRIVAAELQRRGEPFVIVEADTDRVAELKEKGQPIVEGNGALADVLDRADLADARRLIVAIPNTFEAARIIERALEVNAKISIIARAHSDSEVEYLEKHGAQTVIMGERQIALEMISQLSRTRMSDGPAAAQA